MPTDVILPRVDMDMATGKISRWFVEDSGEVTKGQLLFEIETDKAAMDVEAPASGILKLLAPGHGPDIPVGSTVALIFAPGEPQDISPAPAETLKTEVPAEAPRGPTVAPSPVPIETGNSAGIRATPLARRLARQHGLELSTIRGSGPRGRIGSADIASTLALPLNTPPVHGAAAPLHHVWLRKGDGVPVVALHGFGADLNSWRALLRATPSVPVPVLGVDLPGHGKSAYDGQRTLEDLADAVEMTLSAAGLANFHLAGHSLGAAVAALIAARRKLAVRSLFLVSPAGLGPDMDGAFIAGFLRSRSAESLRPWLERLVEDPAQLSESIVKAALQQRAEAAGLAGQVTVADSLFPDGTQAFSIRPALALDIPVKIIFGSADRIIPVQHARNLPGRVGVHIFQGVGHMPHVEARDDVAALLAETIRSA